jgi:hypothetical protein
MTYKTRGMKAPDGITMSATKIEKKNAVIEQFQFVPLNYGGAHYVQLPKPNKYYINSATLH